MIAGGVLLIVAVAALATLFFSTLSYSLRAFARAGLESWLERRGRVTYLDAITDHRSDLVFVTAVLRLCANIVILLGLLRCFYDPAHRSLKFEYFLATAIALVLTLLLSVAIPHALARYAAAAIVGFHAPFLNVLRIATLPIAKIMHATDGVVRNLAGASDEPETKQIEQEILSAVEEGEKEGVVDEQERELIESVIEFRDTQVGQIMTARPEIVGLNVKSSLEEARQTLQESSYSRVPVYDGTLDHIVGILYARDLIRHLGPRPAAEPFDLRNVVRPTVYVPETKRVQALLQDFRQQKVHIALVLDEYGGTVGLVTIEDILEELVGDISDEHEGADASLLKRIDDRHYEADARTYIERLNRELGLALPEEAGYDTLGGFISTTLGRIPQTGTMFEHAGVKYTVLGAEPQKITRVGIELSLQPVPSAVPPPLS